VRDSLSLLDQAIAHGASTLHGAIHADAIRAMLGTGDRARIIDMFEATMKGDAAAAMAGLRELYNQGADPLLVLSDFAEFVHFVTRQKLAPGAGLDAAVSEDERKRGAENAARLSIGTLSRAWQIVSKGLADIKDSPRPLAAADMVLVRLAYAADLPTPEDALRRLADAPSAPALPSGNGGSAGGGSGGGGGATMRQAAPGAMAGDMRQGGPTLAAVRSEPRMSVRNDPAPQAEPAQAPRVVLNSFEDLVTLARTHRDIQLRSALERDVRLVRFERGQLEFALAPGASPQLAATLSRKLQEWTGERWMVAISSRDGAPTLHERQQERDRETMSGVRADPLVRSVLEAFPGAEIMAVRAPEAEAGVADLPGVSILPGNDEVAYVDQAPDEDDD
jgi:DNA polymerase III subunit gamma/tau